MLVSRKFKIVMLVETQTMFHEIPTQEQECSIKSRVEKFYNLGGIDRSFACTPREFKIEPVVNE